MKGRVLFVAVAVAVLAIMLLTGCDSFNVRQYRISGAANVPDDVDKVKAVLKSVAEKQHLVDMTQQSLTPRTIVFYKEPTRAPYAVLLGSRMVDNDVIVDLLAGFGPVPKGFKEAKRTLEPSLASDFGWRFWIVEHAWPTNSARSK